MEVFPMVQPTMLPQLMLCLLSSPLLYGQQGTVPAKMPEFPVILQQTVTAGKTPVGTKVEAKLIIATLLNGTVIPRNATLTGEVTESTAKTATNPSRLAVRMESVQWKNGSSAITLYFTGSYYPNVDEAGQDLQYGPEQPARRTWNGQGEYPADNSHVYRPFPSGDSDKGSSGPDESSSTMAKNAMQMKNVEVQRASDGTIVLTSKRSNIKLERYTTYVAASGDAAPQK
jgi:hypothetical protein